jgi:hypothetical protein
MDEATFEIDAKQLRITGQRFPAHRLQRQHVGTTVDVGYLRDHPEFCMHAWDEGGR